MPRALFLIFLSIALLGAAPGFSAEKKKRKDAPVLPTPPPQPVAQEVTVRRGDVADITLKIYGRKYENLTYIIREKPKAGKLEAPRVVSQETSVVTYHPPADYAIKRDRFTYAVQNRDGVSAPVEVVISIVDEAVQLIAPDTIEFAPLLTGGAALKEMEISNIGGAIAEGVVQVRAPWKIEGPAEYRLTSGGRQKLLVFFEPKSAGVFNGEIRYTSQPDRVTLLRGIGEAAIAATPPELQMMGTSGSTVRMGRLELANNTDAEQTLTLQTGPRLHAPPTVTLPAGGKQEVSISADESNPAVLEDALLIDGGGLQVRVPIRASAIGPVLKVEPVIRFPVARKGQPSSVSLPVENVGGAEGFWKCELVSPFRMETPNVRIPPREKREIKVAIATEEAGTYRGWIRFEGEQQKEETRLEAEVVETTMAQPSTSARVAATTQADVSVEVQEAAMAKAAEDRATLLLFLKDNVKVRDVSSDRATLEWPTSLTSGAECRVEMRTLRMDDQGQLRAEWYPPPEIHVTQKGDRFAAELRRLRPLSMHTVRVLPVAAENEKAEPLFITQFQTAPPKEPRFRVTGFRAGLVLLGVLAAGAYAWKRVRQGRTE